MEEITLVQTAARLKVPYSKALRLVLIGKLEGEQVNGRWWVNVQSIKQMEIRQGTPAGLPMA